MRNADIIGPTGVDPIYLAAGSITPILVLENCHIFVGSGATNAIRSAQSTVTNVVIANGLVFDKPIDAKILLQGNWQTTNTLDVSLIADNQIVPTAGAQYIRISSDNATAANRTFVLVTTTMQRGQMLTLEWVGTNQGELVDDSSMTGGGNVRLSAVWPTAATAVNDTITLIYNGTDLIEVSRSGN